MKNCSNKTCPTKHCARQLIASLEGIETVQFEPEISSVEAHDDDEQHGLFVRIKGRYFAFHCEGYLVGRIG